MSDLIDRTELLKKAIPKNPDAEFHCVSVKDIVAMPSAEPDVLDTNVEDTISRKAAIEAFQKELCREREYAIGFSGIERILNALPSAEPEPSIPLSWFDEQIERLKGLDNAFATLTALQISGMVKKWSDEQNG